MYRATIRMQKIPTQVVVILVHVVATRTAHAQTAIVKWCDIHQRRAGKHEDFDHLKLGVFRRFGLRFGDDAVQHRTLCAWFGDDVAVRDSSFDGGSQHVLCVTTLF